MKNGILKIKRGDSIFACKLVSFFKKRLVKNLNPCSFIFIPEVKIEEKPVIGLLLILLVTGINQSVTFVRSSGPQASQTNETYYTGNLIVKDNEVYTIENETFRIKGNVFIYDEGKLIIRNSCVIIEDSWSNEFVVDG